MATKTSTDKADTLKTYKELREIDVSKHIEKKNNLSYLSWAWAVDQLLLLDADASWEYGEIQTFGETKMVFCTVSAFGKKRTAQLPVMDYKNKAIANPDAFAVNTAMQRCLAKAIALHGIGLYIYAGEDVPNGEEKKDMKPFDKSDKKTHKEWKDAIDAINNTEDADSALAVGRHQWKRLKELGATEQELDLIEDQAKNHAAFLGNKQMDGANGIRQ